MNPAISQEITESGEAEAARYHRLKLVAGIASWTINVLVPVALLAFRGTHALRDLTLGWVANDAAAIPAYTAIVVIGLEVVGLPLSLWSGYLIEHHFGLSRQRLRDWAGDWLKGLALQLLFAIAAIEGLYAALRLFPDAWWAIVAGAFSLFVIVLAGLAPVLLMPLFFKFEPLQDEQLRARLMNLADRVGTRVRGVWLWRLGDKTRKSNAALVGWGNTRRIIVADTLIASHPPDEIEVVLAHELGHQVHRDIPRGLALQVPLAFLGFYIVHLALPAWSEPLGLAGPSDFAGLPLLMIITAAVSLALLPAASAYSRHRERAADEFALRTTGMADQFIAAMSRLASQNMSQRRPHPILESLLHSHPSIEKRIAFARAWAASQAAGSPDQQAH